MSKPVISINPEFNENILKGRIRTGLTAYAACDALGVPWEGKRPEEIIADQIETIPSRDDLPQGSTSDDTALTLLVSKHIIEQNGTIDQYRFLRELSHKAPAIRRMGPSTRAAVDYFIKTGSMIKEGGNTNGAAMRALPLGWAIPVSIPEKRRDQIVKLSRTTHKGPDAIVGASVIAAMASLAVEGCSIQALLEIGHKESGTMAARLKGGYGVYRNISNVLEDKWIRSPAGISIEVPETLAAVFYILKQNRSLKEAVISSVKLGGDTDTTACLVGGLLGCRGIELEDEITWLGLVKLPTEQEINEISNGIARLRMSHYD
jgi:ADP-ribosyl-[dinitrogen reductase] hydrolase